MNIVITGALGHISRPLTQQLTAQGHNIIVISSSNERQRDIEAIGANAAIGTLEDAAFLTKVFNGADAVYTMIPPNHYNDPGLQLIPYYHRLGHNYAQAIEAAGVQHVVNLSSIGAHMSAGNGILRGAHGVEQILNVLPKSVSITHLRPTSFYYNLYAYIPQIKAHDIIAANYGENDMVPWVAPYDIAMAAAEELTATQQGRKIRYVCSEELSCSSTAAILGEAIGKPDLQWQTISDETMLEGMKAAGMNPDIAAGLVEMYGALHTGVLAADYLRNRPAVMGSIKLKDFAKDFAAVYNQK